MAWTIRKHKKGNPMSLIEDPSAPPKPHGKSLSMTMLIPSVEEPVIWIMVATCKSNNVYVGHQPGQEMGAFKLCLGGADTLHTVAMRALKEHEGAGLIAVPAGFSLPDPPPRRAS
jgi:hypothetical protein